MPKNAVTSWNLWYNTWANSMYSYTAFYRHETVWYFQLDCIMSCLMSCTINLIGLPKSTKWQQNPSLESITWSCHLNLSHEPAKMTGSQDHPNINLVNNASYNIFTKILQSKNNRLSIFWISVQYFMLNILYSISENLITKLLTTFH